MSRIPAAFAPVLQLFRKYGRTGGYIAVSVSLLLLFALLLLGDQPRWIATWDGPYAVEICPGLYVLDDDADARIAAAYEHVGRAGQPTPVAIARSRCDDDEDPGVVRWDAHGLRPGIGHGVTRIDHDDGRIQSVTVWLRMGEDPHPSLYRHEAWHTIGADHPWLPSSGHVLHPTGVDGVWGDSVRGYRR